VLDYIRDCELTAELSPILSTASSSDHATVDEIALVEICNSESPLIEESTLEGPDISGTGILPFPRLESDDQKPNMQFKKDESEDLVPPASPVLCAAEVSPFKRWLSTLRRRHDHGSGDRSNSLWDGESATPQSRHQKAFSLSSSTGVLTAVKSATLTLAGTSIAPTSRHARHGQLHSDNASNSFRGPRLSMDSVSPYIETGIDCKAWFRSIQRRNIVEEILQSEESYISDMKVMVHVRPLHMFNDTEC
jgi:hypothetical protein